MEKSSYEATINDKDFKKLKDEGIVELKGILRVLVNYYNAINSGCVKTPSASFRETFSTAEGGEVYIKDLGDYTYLIFCKLGDDYESWLHVDGISQERDELTKKGISSHPVFGITCLKDILAKNKKRAKKKIKEVA
jgi:hypothetical protein